MLKTPREGAVQALEELAVERIIGGHSHDAALPPSFLDAPTAARLARVFQTLGDPTRIRIISLLLEGEQCVHTITTALGMTQSAVSHQLRTMRDMRLVRARKAGRHVFYALDDAHIAGLFRQTLAHIGHQ